MSGGGRASLDRMPEWGNASYKDGVDEDVYQAAFDAVESLLYPTDSMTSSFPTAADRNGICDYRSLRRSPASKSSIREGDWVGTSSLRRPHAPKAPKAPSLPGLDRPAPPDSLPVKSVLEGDPGLGRSHAVFSGSISPTSPAETYSVAQVQKFHSSNGSLNSSIFLEDLRESELHLKRKKAFIERVIEQHENLSEQKRRQDIFQLCEKLQEVEVASNKPHHKSSRIKTNGSLPREKSGTDSSLPSSPVKSCSSSDDIQTLRLSDGVQPSSQAKAQSPSALQTSHGYENVPSNACVARRARQAAASNGVSADRPFRLLDCPASPASPLSTPGSPRRGIKTVLAAKETFSFPQEITNEVIENHLGLSELYKPTQQLSSKGKPSENTSPFCSPFGSLALTSTPREQTRESVRGRNGQSSPAVVTKDKFIFPLHHSRVCNHGELLSEKVVALSLELEFVQKERLKIMSALTVLKSRLAEIESQQEEAARDVAMEQAFIKAELQAKADKLRAQKAKILSLQGRADSCQREIESWQENRNKQQKIFSMSVENAEVDLTQLRSELGRCEGEEARAELKERIYQQTDVVDSEKKLYEDLEFKYLEEESVWLARKEELNKELSDALKKYDEYSDQVSQLESWLTGPNESSVAQSEGLAEQKLAYLQRLEEGQSQLDLLDARIDELVGQGAGTLGSSQNISRDVNESELMNASSTGDLDSTDVSSERLCNSPLPNSLESSYYSYHLNASLYGDGDREAAPSQTSRRDRERRTTEDGEPEGRRRAEDGSKSGVDSDTSSNAKYFPVSSPVGSDGVLGVHGAVLSRFASQSTSTIGDLVGHSGHGGAGVPGLLDGAVAGTLPLCRRRRPEAERTLPRHQRPLTRYLPIRAADLDLRQHIESAGHAVDLCSHVILDGHSCRGTLHKASTRFGNWQKRWFLFDRTSRTLTYYKSRRDRHVRGGVHFQSIAEVYVDHLHGAKHHPNCVFVVKTTQRSYQLTAPTPEAMRIWVDVIFTGAEAYQEFD